MRKVIWSVVAIVVAVIMVSLSGCGPSQPRVYDFAASEAKAKQLCEARGHALLRYEINKGRKFKRQLQARCLDLDGQQIYVIRSRPVTK